MNKKIFDMLWEFDVLVKAVTLQVVPFFSFQNFIFFGEEIFIFVFPPPARFLVNLGGHNSVQQSLQD